MLKKKLIRIVLLLISEKHKRYIYFFGFLFFASISGFSQVGINTTSPDASSILDVDASDKGILIPRVSLTNVTTTMLDGSNTSATGLLIYNTNAAVVGGNGVGYYYFNGTTWERLTTSATSDDDVDWYEEGTTTSPNSINDDIYTQGNVAIGKTTADVKLDVETSGSTGIRSRLTGSGSGTRYGIYVQNGNSSSSELYGTYNILNGNGDGVKVGTRNFILNSGNGSHYGTSNYIISTSSTANQYGTNNTVGGAGNNTKYGTYNSLSGGTDGIFYGSYQVLNCSSIDNQYGVYSYLSGDGDGALYGSYKSIANTGTGSHTGSYNSLSGSGTGSQYGVNNRITNSGDGNHYGTYNFINSSGSGNKYGIFNQIVSTTNGTHYGVYSNVLKAGSYAGYFLGNVSIGTTVGNNYLFPAFRGSANQVIQTDGSGNLNWVDTSSFQIVTGASNGLSLSSNQVILGGVLSSNTSIATSTNELAINLNSTGDFVVQDAGTNIFQINDSGETNFGRDTFWRDGTITGTTIATLIDDGNDGRFRIYENGSTSVDLDANTGFVFNEQGLDRNFRIEGDSRNNIFFIDAGNNRIGIGDSSPTYDVQLKQSDDTQGGVGGIGFESSSSSNKWKIYHSGTNFSFAENGTRRAYITGATGVYVVTSDKRKKKNIVEVESIISKVNNLKTYRYLYKDQDNSAKKTIGFMAQDVQRLFPELVETGEDGFLGLNYAGFGVIAIKAIQEQEEEIENLKIKNQELEARLTRIEALLND